MFKWRIVPAVFLLLFLLGASHAQPEPITWSLTTEVQENSNGKVVLARLKATIAPGWHLYSPDQQTGGPIPTRISLPADSSFRLTGDVTLPVASTEIDPNFNLETQFYEGEAIFYILLAPNESSGNQSELAILVSFQTCNASRCLPPKRIRVTTVHASETLNKRADTALADFEFTDFEGKKHRLSDYRGKTVLLDFWATWCGPCLAEMPRLRAIYDRYRAHDFEIIGLDAEALGQDSVAIDVSIINLAKKTIAAKGAIWVHAAPDSASRIATRLFKLESLPAKILVGKDGRIIKVLDSMDDLESLLEK